MQEHKNKEPSLKQVINLVKSQTNYNEDQVKEKLIEGSLLGGKEAKIPSPGIRRKYFSMNPMSIDEARYIADQSASHIEVIEANNIQQNL